MNKFRILVIVGTVIAVTAIVGLIYVVAFRNPAANPNNAEQVVDGISYVNNEFGYSLTFPKTWEGYKVSQAEENIMFYIPSDGMYKDLGYKYGAILYITAVPMSEVEKQEVKCKTPDENRHWAECAAVNESIGGNNAYKFYTRFADDYMTGHEDEGRSVQKSIKFFDVETAPAKRTFRSIQKNYIYEFEYPTNLFEPEYGASVFLPYSKDNETTYAEIELFHTINTKYCGLSGECKPTTEDMKFGVANLENQTFAKLKNSSIGEQLIERTVGNNEILILSQGAEGEGMNYSFIENPNGGVLLVYHKYIDENVVTNYRTVKDFIPFYRQSQIIEGVLKSVKFTN